jgi:hypothetical protein
LEIVCNKSTWREKLLTPPPPRVTHLSARAGSLLHTNISQWSQMPLGAKQLLPRLIPPPSHLSNRAIRTPAAGGRHQYTWSGLRRLLPPSTLLSLTLAPLSAASQSSAEPRLLLRGPLRLVNFLRETAPQAGMKRTANNAPSPALRRAVATSDPASDPPPIPFAADESREAAASEFPPSSPPPSTLGWQVGRGQSGMPSVQASTVMSPGRRQRQ